MIWASQRQDWAACSHWVNNGDLCVLKPSRIKYDDWAKAWPELGDAREQWPQPQHHIYIRMAEKEQNQGVAMTQSLDLNLTYMLWQDLKSAA